MTANKVVASATGIVCIENKSKRYSLNIDTFSRPLSKYFAFQKILFNAQIGGDKKVGITARELDCYRPDIASLDINPDCQYLEIGAGLGGFIPHVVECMRRSSPRPIVIDQADYVLMKEMLQEASMMDLGQEISERLQVLIQRCDLYLDPSKVRLVNTTLGQAVKQHPDLKEVADVVVQESGANLYPLTEKCAGDRVTYEGLERRISRFERYLLKKEGRLLSYL